MKIMCSEGTFEHSLLKFSNYMCNFLDQIQRALEIVFPKYSLKQSLLTQNPEQIGFLYKVKTSIEQTCKYTIIFSSQVQVLVEAHRHTDTLKKLKNCLTDKKKHRHTDTHKHRHTASQTDTNCITIKKFYLCMENPSFENKKTSYKNPIFSGFFFSNGFLREFWGKKQFQGLFESGPKSCT